MSSRGRLHHRPRGRTTDLQHPRPPAALKPPQCRVSTVDVNCMHLETAANRAALFRKERRIYPAGHSITLSRCRIKSLCEKHPSCVGDEVTSLKLLRKRPISGEK